MKIENLNDLKKIIQLCRKTGVEAIEIGDLKMNLGPIPAIVVKNTKSQKTEQKQTYTPGGITEDTLIPTDSLTDEQLLMWSAQGPEQQ